MSFFDDIKCLPEVAPFEGGNDRQRVHINELVANQNEIIQSANRHFQDNGAGVIGVWLNLAGERTFVNLLRE